MIGIALAQLEGDAAADQHRVAEVERHAVDVAEVRVEVHWAQEEHPTILEHDPPAFQMLKKVWGRP